MEESTARALHNDRTIDITTTGRKSGTPRRIEIALVSLGDRLVISGSPGRPRGWYANLRANPEFTIHLKKGVHADLSARATPVLDEAERRAIMLEMTRHDPRRRDINIDEWVAGSPLVNGPRAGLGFREVDVRPMVHRTAYSQRNRRTATT